MEAEAAVEARPRGAQNAKTRNTDFIHRCWGATENFKLKEIWTGSLEGQPRAWRPTRRLQERRKAV